MPDSQKIAIAAQMHVQLRRKTGRVTDTEWMAQNAEYAREIVRFARNHAREAGDEELAALAEKVEKVLLAEAAPAPQTALERLRARAAEAPGSAPRYVGGIR